MNGGPVWAFVFSLVNPSYRFQKTRLKGRLLRAAFEATAWVLSWPVSAYIVVHRNRLRGGARSLEHGQRALLQLYFDSKDLDRILVVVRDPLPLSEPPLAGMARRLGLRFPSIALTEAITLESVIVSRTQMDTALLFHELVHAVQYRLLGVRGFARRYVLGFLLTQSYVENPMEGMAFDLTNSFSSGCSPFRVEQRIREGLGLNRDGGL